MKNKLLKNAMEGALIASVVFSVFFFVKFYFQSKQLREFNIEMATYQQNRAMLNMVVSEAATYSQQDPSINPLLEMVGVRLGKPGSVAAPKPAAK